MNELFFSIMVILYLCFLYMIESREAMKVIGAGFGRTGTMSLYTALNQLGYKTHHMKEVFFKNQDLLWADVFENKISVDTLLDYMADQGYNATTDYPGCLFYEEYFRRYPDAKVILSVRDSAEAWYRSVVETLGTTREVHFNRPMTWIKPGMKTIVYNVWKRSGNVTYDIRGIMDKRSAIKAYNKWIEQVKQKIPSDQLLIHNFKDGWLPLCQFLHLYDDQCPYNRGETYPYVNETKQFKKIFSILKMVTKWFDFTLGLLIGLIVSVLLMYGCCIDTPSVKQHLKNRTSVIKMD